MNFVGIKHLGKGRNNIKRKNLWCIVKEITLFVSNKRDPKFHIMSKRA